MLGWGGSEDVGKVWQSMLGCWGGVGKCWGEIWESVLVSGRDVGVWKSVGRGVRKCVGGVVEKCFEVWGKVKGGVEKCGKVCWGVGR